MIGEIGDTDRELITPEPKSIPDLTAIILTYNEAQHIEACIESLNWAERLLVFDSYSDDGTVGLAKAAGAEVEQAIFSDYAQQRNHAASATKTEWIFFVDADERGTPELAREIARVLGQGPEVGWYVPRHNYIFGRLTLGAGWYPDYQLRLFSRDRVHYERPVHEVAVVKGQVGYLRNHLIHFNYRDLGQFQAKQKAYTNYDAAILKQQGIRPKPYSYLTKPLRHFWWRFITLKGYRDGSHGLRLSAYMAYYEWVKYRKLSSLWQKG